MKTSTGDDVRDLHYGKFSDPMAVVLFDAMLNGDFGDDEYSDGEGTWGIRYGRRVLEGDDHGFVYYFKLDTVEQATSEFRAVAENYEQDEEETR